MWACSLPKTWLLNKKTNVFSHTSGGQKSKIWSEIKVSAGLYSLRRLQGSRGDQFLASQLLGAANIAQLVFTSLKSLSSRTHCLFFSACQISLCLSLTRMVVTEFVAHSNNLGFKFLKLSHIYGGGGGLPYKLHSQVPRITDCSLWGQLFNLLLYSEWFNYHTSIPWDTKSAIKRNELSIPITIWVNGQKNCTE